MSTNWADTSISVTDFIGNAAGLAAKIGSGALPIVQFVAGLGIVPGLGPALEVLTVAEPILMKVAAGAPIFQQLLKNGKPTIDALQAASPDLLHNLKQLYAVAVNHDPDQEATDLRPEEVSNSQVVSFVGGSLFERSFFTPQDPRFDRTTNS